MILARNLLTARAPCATCGGIYRRSIVLGSGRYALLDDGVGLRLVRGKPVIEQRLGQQIAATIRIGAALWEISRQQGLQR